MTQKRQTKPVEERTIVSFDYAIKNVLRDRANFDILEGFLSELLERDVSILGILESESNRDDKDGKTNRVDLKAKMGSGEIVIFELQFLGQADFFGRALYGASKAIVEQISAGDDYNIKKVYSINIAYFDLNTEREYLFHADMQDFKGVHYDERIPFAQYDALKPPTPGEYIHPEYYLILPNKFDEQIKSLFDEWMHILKHSSIKSNFRARGTKKAGIKLDVLKMTKQERAAYEKFLINRQSLDSSFRTTRSDALAEGEARGMAKGLKEGQAKGLKEGQAKGLKEGQAKGLKKGQAKGLLQAAKAMKTEGIDVKTIAKVTGLATGRIRQL
ncbi:MAG: PD-(D/E)XK nuclease family transposase [Chitinispirillales bacterium]|jgi:hypothetical protein|nr:PD-(D/E)XK nuclease family transposase [Chitinispirillales bacterium]